MVKNRVIIFILFLFMFGFVFGKPKNLVKTIELPDGRKIDQIYVPGGYPPDDYEPQNIPLTRTDVIISGVPGFRWAYGCSATSAAMAMGYYDNVGYNSMYTGPTNGGVCPLPDTVTPYWTSTTYSGGTCYECPISATHNGFDGRATAGHVDDYWIDFNSTGPDPWVTGGVEHTYGDCTGDYMGTNQWSAADSYNSDGGTVFWFATNGYPTDTSIIAGWAVTFSGITGIKNFVESRGYSIFNDGSNYVCYNQFIAEEGLTFGFTFAQYKNEIDNNRPVLIQVDGHTMLGVGYNDDTNEVILHNTWDYHRNSGVYVPERMVWAGTYYGMEHYGVGVFVLEESSDPEPREYGDAPEDAVAYPSLGTIGFFPTCKSTGPASYIEHTNFGAYFGASFDLETEGNAANCPTFSNLYNQDECFNDGDAGLILPASYTITGSPGAETVVACNTSSGSLGSVCTSLTWGTNIDINVTNLMPNNTIGYVNVLFDWNQDGQWANDASTQCNSSMVAEHLVVNHSISNGYSGPLSAIGGLPIFTIGPNSGYVWVRFSITESQVSSDWDGSGVFEDGETEDYLIKIDDEQLDFGDLPDLPYQTLLANDGARHVIDGITYLGSSVDSDNDGQPTSYALGDDNDGNDDEDGVLFMNSFVKGQQCTLKVITSTSAYLNVWFDWNDNGVFDSTTNEHYIVDLLTVVSPITLFINVPVGAANNCYSRFRFSSITGLNDQGLAPDGEVEDYRIIINDPIENPKQTNPQYPDPNGWDVNITEPALMADDWQCNETGWIEDVHFWVSVLGDIPFEPSDITNLHLSIHNDIPAEENPDGYSMPLNPPLWEENLPFGELFTITPEPVFAHPQGWIDPGNFYDDDNHLYCYRIDVPALPEPFLQEEGTIYWLDVSLALSAQSEAIIGWKTTLDHWNDDAVWQPTDLPGEWQELIDPTSGESLDMAFVLTGSPFEEEDFGDLPDSYKTLLASNGARHTIDMSYYLGAAIDAEMDGQPGTYAIDDDNDAAPDDEDGVTFTSSLLQGSSANIEVVTSNDGYLNAWLDYNIDGDFDDNGEHVFIDQSLNSGLNTLQIDIPDDATSGLTAMRFRFTSYQGGVNYYGSAMNGEVEDYMVLINEPIEDTKMENPQFPDPAGIDIKMTDPYVLADDWLCSESGTIDDLHFWVSTPLDEPTFASNITFIHLSIHSDFPADHPENMDGFSQPLELLWETDIDSDLFVVNTEEVFSHPQSWYDPGTGTFVEEDHNNCYRIDIPSIPEPFIQEEGTIYWLDLSLIMFEPMDVGWKTTIDHWNDDGVFQSGAEAEWQELTHPITGESLDFAFVVTGSPLPEDELDFGDSPDPTYPTLLANDGARHIISPSIYLGTNVDAEADGQPSTNIDADDNDGNDDEDGIKFLTPFYLQMQAAFDVTVYSSGYLNIWIDWNQNGSWADISDHIVNDRYLASSGVYQITTLVSTAAILGNTAMRVRYSTQSGLSYDGVAPDGEVEDYQVEIVSNEIEHKMHYIQWPDTTSHGMDIEAAPQVIQADDFSCRKTELITEIVVWGSWYDDILPTHQSPVTLSIWSDLPLADPSNPHGFSQPLSLLWAYDITAEEYLEELYLTTQGEGWYDPDTGIYTYPGDTEIWQYTFNIPAEVAFQQEQGTIYWLAVEFIENDIPFGWKTSFNQWNDNAVWQSPVQPWTKISYPTVHDYYGSNLDLAFYINGQLATTDEIEITVLSDRLYISWDAVPGAASYKIYYCDDPYGVYPTDWTYLGQTLSLYFEDGPPAPNADKRFYRIIAQ